MTTIDAEGNASFSGQIIADSLQINTDASIAGTLTADRVDAKNINKISDDVRAIHESPLQNITVTGQSNLKS